MTADPRAVKRERRALRRDLLDLIEGRLRTHRCFWTWPWGHDWPDRVTYWSTRARSVSRCEACGRPYSWGPFSIYDLLEFADEKAGVPESELEPYIERWRALP